MDENHPSQRSSTLRNNLTSAIVGLYDLTSSQIKGIVDKAVDLVRHAPREHPSNNEEVSECDTSVLITDSDVGTCNDTPAREVLAAPSASATLKSLSKNAPFQSFDSWSDDDDFVITNPEQGRGIKRQKTHSTNGKGNGLKRKSSKLILKRRKITTKQKKNVKASLPETEKRSECSTIKEKQIPPSPKQPRGTKRGNDNATPSKAKKSKLRLQRKSRLKKIEARNCDTPGPSHYLGSPGGYVSIHAPPPPLRNRDIGLGDVHDSDHFDDDFEELHNPPSHIGLQRGGQKQNPDPFSETEKRGGKRKTKAKHLDPIDSQSRSSMNSCLEQDDLGNNDSTLNNDSDEINESSQNPTRPKWRFIDSKTNKRFGVREVWYDFIGDVPEHSSIHEIIEYIRLSLSELRTLLLQDTQERDYVRLVLVSDQLNIPIAFPWAMVRDFDISAILERIERVLNSNQEFLLNPGFTIRFHHVQNPLGGYTRKMDALPDDVASIKKRSIITVPSCKVEKTCFASAIVIARYYANNDIKYRTWSRTDRPPTQKLLKEAAKLHEQAGVPKGKVDSSQYDSFQRVLNPEYRLVIYRGIRKTAGMIYAGQPAKKTLYLYLTESGHFNVIKNVSAFMCAKYFCGKCLEVYNDPRTHDCCDTCYDCFSQKCDRNDASKRDPRICTDCNMTFLTEHCFQAHSVILFKGSSACQTRQKCPKCERVFDPALFPGDPDDHDCSQIFCRTCKEYVDGPTHECYMKVTKESKYYVPTKDDKLYDAVFRGKGKKKSKKGGKKSKDLSLNDLPTPQKYIFFDFECTQNTDSHVPNLVHATWDCTNCMDGVTPNSRECLWCGEEGEPREITFKGDDTLNEFCNWLFSKNNDKAIAIAHNAKAYDSYFLLNHLVSQGIVPEVIMNGGKIISLSTHDPKIIIKDSLNFFQMGLAKLPKTFGLQEMKKGYFPHLFNVRANENYIGPIPEKKFYGTRSMMGETLKEFNEWYDKIPSDFVFDFQKEILEYCKSDVQILHESCKLFRDHFKTLSATEKNPDGIDPFLRSLTLPSACNLLFRTNFLKPNKIALIPCDGYSSPKRHSIKAAKWLHYQAEERGIDIKHAFTGGERKVHGRYVDGYAEVGEEKHIFEFLGCFYHGCSHCYNPSTINKRCNKSMSHLHNEVMERIHRLQKAGYKVHYIWEHEWDIQVKNPTVNARVHHLDDKLKNPLNPRDSFFGGRTDGCTLFDEAKPGEKILYYDFTSLYPFINKFGKYPLGHPRIIRSNFPPLEKTFGLIQCEITPPKDLYHPVLPYRSSGKLTFPLCAACAESLNQTRCTHDDRERALNGVWVSEEIKKAVEKGYYDIKISEIWHFDRYTQFDKRELKGGLFAEYIDAFMKVKQESSGFPASAVTESDRTRYIMEYFDHEGLLLDSTNVKKNPGMRAISKQVLNCLWGKLAEKDNHKQTKYVKTPAQLLQYFRDDSVTVHDMWVLNEDLLEVQYTNARGFVEQNVNTNIVIASFTTALARLKLYSILEKLGDRALYYDTDSVVFKTNPSLEPFDPKTGNYLGDLTNEIDPTNEEYIRTWVCGGPKNYSYKTNKGNTVCKVRGFTLNHTNSLVINHDTLKELIQSESEETRTIHESKIVRDGKTKTIHTVESKKDYRVVFTKRVRVGDGTKTLPYGHKDIS